MRLVMDPSQFDVSEYTEAVVANLDS